jgi:hypothetical protein
MSVNPISGTAQQPLSSAAAAAAAPLQSAPQQTVAVTPPKHDSVTLTGTALAKSLKLAGQNAAQIAQKMGIDIKTVDGYLSIKVVTPPTISAPPAAKTGMASGSMAMSSGSMPSGSMSMSSGDKTSEATESGAQKATEVAQGKK